MVYCGSSSDSFGLGVLMFLLKSLMKDGTAVSLCQLVLQDGEDSLTIYYMIYHVIVSLGGRKFETKVVEQ